MTPRTFTKRQSPPRPGLLRSEAEGLRWLAQAPDGAPVPQVLEVDDERLVLEWIPPGPATADMAEELGRRLAATHRAGADSFGAPWPGFIGPLAMPNDPRDDWPAFYAEQRVRPFLHALPPSQRRPVEAVLDHLDAVAGPPEPPSRIHGDLWSGNVVWGADGRAWLVDPAAHGGHRETDLAMLALFGAPHLDRIVAAYDEAHPLAGGWRERVALHQLHPLVVHAALFGGAYAARAAAAATAVWS